jgi:hypothetical protein
MESSVIAKKREEERQANAQKISRMLLNETPNKPND